MPTDSERPPEEAPATPAADPGDAASEGTIAAREASTEFGGPEPGGPEPGVYVRLVMRDTGTGMDEITQRRAFEAFYTTKTDGAAAKGTGLGLSSVFLVVTGIGGAVRAESAPGSGTPFIVDLPALEA